MKEVKKVATRKGVLSKKGSKAPSSSSKSSVKKTAKRKVAGKAVKKRVIKSSAKKVVKRAARTSKKTVKRKVIKKGATKKSKVARVSSGIKNLDRIIQGGFEKNSTNLVVGGSGNGKSIFAIQFLIDGIKKGENVMYVSFEEKKKDFYTNMLELGWDLEAYEKTGKFFFLSYSPEKVKSMLDEGGGDIENIVLSKNIQRIAMDSITTFVMLFENEVEMRENALALFSQLRSWDCTSLLIYERDPLVDKKQSSRVLEFEADSLILLYFTRLKSSRERFLEVYKMRGTNHSTNIFPYEIKSKKGVVVSARAHKGKLNSSGSNNV